MFQDSIPEKEVSDNPSYHRENKFHQYDSTFHFYFGSEVIESAHSMIRFSSLFLSLLSLKHQVSNPETKMPNSSNCGRL